MNRTMMIVTNPTLESLFDAIVALNETGVPMESTVQIAPLANVVGGYAVTVTEPAPHKGVKQRCRTTDHDGRRCIKGPRHSGNHRYEQEGSDDE